MHQHGSYKAGYTFMEMAGARDTAQCTRGAALKREVFEFPGGVHPEQHKLESVGDPIAKAPLPSRLIVPLSQHIGTPSVPTVNPGDHVLKGQVIARAEGYVSVPQHAPSSGRVAAIGPLSVPHPSGLSAPCIVIDTDGEDRWIDHGPEGDYHRADPSHLRNLVREAGIVGLGGAGFPTFIKLNPGTGKHIDTLIINGIECEPFITCDDLLMRERAQDIVAGARVMRHALQAREVVIAVEDNKPIAAAALRAACADTDFSVASCPTVYPQGGEKQLLQVITGKEIPSNGLPLHIGVVVQNVATAVAVHDAIELGRPLVSRIITVTGSGVRRPRNYQALIGTPMRELLRLSEVAPRLDRLIVGGPMMGFIAQDDGAPVIKTTNCLLAMAQPLDSRGPQLPCIRCGACAQVCPATLLPQQLYWFSAAQDWDKAQEHHLFDCIECGCCSYVCPSNIPLVHYYRHAKGHIWKQEQERAKADIARKRHEFRLERLDREKRERTQRHSKKKEDLAAAAPASDTAAEDAKKAAIAAAMERAAAKKAARQAETTGTSAATPGLANDADAATAADLGKTDDPAAGDKRDEQR
jgi:electron transport complex protein RnfC